MPIIEKKIGKTIHIQQNFDLRKYQVPFESKEEMELDCPKPLKKNKLIFILAVPFAKFQANKRKKLFAV